jgi:TetR/AcrR family transcriptional regulator
MRKGQERREKILEVAEEVFAQKGFNGASLEEIAEKVGVTKPALYYYYRSKKELYNAVFWNNLYWVESIQLTGEPKEDLKRYIQMVSELFKNKRFAKMFGIELSLGMANLEEETLKVVAGMLQLLSKIVAPTGANPFFLQTLIISSTITYYNTLELRQKVKELVELEQLDPHFDLEEELQQVIFRYLEL